MCHKLAVVGAVALTAIGCAVSPGATEIPATTSQEGGVQLEAPMTVVLPSGLPSEKEARAIAIEAYLYFYPLVTMDVTRRVTTNLPVGVKPGLGPAGMFHHLREYPSADFREVVRPNFDTLYSVAWFNVAKEPVVFSVPDTHGRYYVAPIYDMWTDAFAAPGSRTSGTGPHDFGLVPVGWKGTLPAGVEKIYMRTETGWIVIRTLTNGPADYAAVHEVQDGYRLVPLSQFGKPALAAPAFTPDPSVDMKTPTVVQVNSMPASKFFPYAAELMKTNPPHVTDWGMVQRLGRLGIVAGKSFDFNAAPDVVKKALEAAPAEGMKSMQANAKSGARVSNGWTMNTDTMGVYGNYYLKRATTTLVGLGANTAEDATYPMILTDATGKPPVGTNNYVLHFAKESLPPVDAFWSITMYDQDGFQVANPINRYAIGDRDSLKFNADGSLDIYIQKNSPGKDKESNWLPAASGTLGITMRLYAPHAEVLDGRWNPPPLALAKEAVPARGR